LASTSRQNVEERAPPRQDVPDRNGGTRLRTRHTRHRDHPGDAEQRRHLDAVEQVLTVREALDRIERVAVAVQRRERQPARGELPEIVLAGTLALAQLLERQVGRREEAAGVDLDAGQAEVDDDVERLAEGEVVKGCVVDTELHDVGFLLRVGRGVVERGGGAFRE
jgi:hypothetical protein